VGDKINSNDNEIIENRFNSHLVKYVEIVGVVIVGEVENAIAGIRSDPIEASIPVRYASWFHLILTKLGRHLGWWRGEERRVEINKTLLPLLNGNDKA
jgi:hypothetical protein